MKKQILLAVLVVLGACADFVPETLRAVEAVDPLTVDPADIALRLSLPDGVAVLPGSARLQMSARQETGDSIAQEFILQFEQDVLAVAPRDHAALRALQAQITAWKAEDPDGTKGSLSMFFDPCLANGPLPPDARASVAIRLAADGTFLPLVTDGDVTQLFARGQPDGIPACE